MSGDTTSLIKALKADHPVRHQCHKAQKETSTTICNCHDKKNPPLACICHKENILIRPAKYEETCFIFDTARSQFGISFKQILKLKSLVTKVVYPFSSRYDFYRLNYNHRFNYFPLAIVLVSSIEDIINTIKFSCEHHLPFRARSGAHCYEPASLVNFGIIIDLRNRNKIVKIDNQKQTVKIESGALVGPVVNELSSQNITFPVGTCVTNGLAGLTLGGGIGFLVREYGLTCDNVVDMKVVLANGTVVHANYNQNKDLFWALRGAGGGNFGIVTDFTFKFNVIDWVTVFTLSFDFKDTKEVFNVWQNWAPNTITSLTTEMDIFHKYHPVIVTGQLLPGTNKEKDQKELFKLLKPLRNLGLHTELSIKTMTLTESAQYFCQGSYARPLFFYNRSDFNFKPLPEEAIDIIIHHMGLLQEHQSFHKTEIDALGGNFATLPSSAFPSRDAIHWFQYTSLWDAQPEGPENIHWLNNYYEALRPFFPEDRKYVNALDYNSTRASALKSYYGPHLPNLVKIKENYDPTNVFNFEQSVFVPK